MGRKKHATYDSKETKTILGLISILLGIFFFISIFSVSQNDLFFHTKNLFGQSTIVTVFFLFSFGLKMLGFKLSFTNIKSLLAQLALVFILPAFLTSFSTSPQELVRNSGGELLGGQIGYFLVQNIFSDTIPTQPGTRIMLFLSLVLALPLAFSMSISAIMDFLSGIFIFLLNLFKRPKAHETQKLQDNKKASTFGDFNQYIKPKKVENKEEKNQIFTKKVETIKFVGNGMPIEIKEGSVGPEGLRQETLRYKNWQLPPLSLLTPYQKTKQTEPALSQNAKIIEETLYSFGIEAKVEDYFIGPSVVQYALNIPLGINVKKISNLCDNLSLALGVDSKAVRIESIPETTYLGIEVPRTKREIVHFKELMEPIVSQRNSLSLPIAIGKNIDGSTIISDIVKLPHLLIAGATGSGKSVLTNSFIASLLLNKTPDEIRLLLVDPKRVELSDYNGIPHLLTPVITNMDEVLNALKWLVGEMDRRYKLLEKESVRNIDGYNQKMGFPSLPYVIVVIDEMADMMMTANRVETEICIVRLAQKARAVGIHLILATQRPSVNVITGIIKANIPGRIGMAVTSSTDSRVILDRVGAESLLGYGDLLYKAPDKVKPIRLQGSFVEQAEINRIVDFIKSQSPEVEYIKEILDKQVLPGEEQKGAAGGYGSEGDLVEQAIRIVVQNQKGSSSFLQRRLNIGFNKAAGLLEELEVLGVVGPANGSKPREVLVGDADAFIASLKGGYSSEN